MPTVADVAGFLDQFAPPATAAEWDNVGLLLGERGATVQRIMTCLTVTPESADEACQESVQLIVTHHPIFFRGAKRLTDTTAEGRTVLQLAKAGVAVYSPHTAFDNTPGGINELLAARLGLGEVVPLQQSGEGRLGALPAPTALRELAAALRTVLSSGPVQVVGNLEKRVRRVAIVCGAGGELLPEVYRSGADVFLTGELRFHDYLAAQAAGLALLLPGHYATERCGVEDLARRLHAQWPTLEVWASRSEADPVQWV